ncbi:heavy-metal-associated domain-containing protein [Microbacterium sp. NPDC088619]|uniref:heavy-metal-associated domain-containing protein n=1 Tax=Microbacterium sp. NPDC088619 TaxID=3364196 RepID=UPI0037F3EC6E
MNAGTRLGLYAGGLVVAFGAAFGLSGLIVPESLVAGWTEQSSTRPSHGGEHTGSTTAAPAQALTGLSLSDADLVLSPVAAPRVIGEDGTLSFHVEHADGTAVTDFAEEHDKELHLIVVRSDGSRFQHVHPTMDAAGTWSIPWRWDEAGTYRAFADFTPAGEDASGVTLTQLLHVDGQFTSAPTEASRVDEVDGFTVTLEGDVAAGSTSELAVTVSRDGESVTALEPYLGAFGHLVALREGDLAYLHVHAEGDEPQAGDTAGPTIGFSAEVPTDGRYLLYFDFQVDGTVHTAEFVVDAAHGGDVEDSDDSGDQTHSDGH